MEISQQSSKKEMDMRQGRLWTKILIFALPLAASSILQQLFNSADMAVVGRFAGSNALAAVGSNSSFINLLINLFVGLSVGANVIIARYLGEGDDEKASRASHTAVVISLISGVFIMIVGIAITRPIMRFMSCPDEVFDLAVLYLRIYFLGMPFIMFYNFGSAILRSQGDTKRPFLCLLVGGVINVILNLVFVVGLGMSVDGVGIATVISNMVSAFMMFWYLTHHEGALKIKIKKLKIDKKILAITAKIGIPSGIQGMVFSFSNVCVQSAINSLGATIAAASAAAINFEFYVWMAINAFTQACVTFTSQNYGAGNLKRCKRVLYQCLGMGMICTVVLSFVFLYFGDTLIKFYTTDPQVIPHAMIRINYEVSFMAVCCIMDGLTGAMRGLGSSVTPAIISAVGTCGIRLLWVYTVFKKWSTFKVLMLVYPVSWSVSAVAMIIAYVIIWKSVSKKLSPNAKVA